METLYYPLSGDIARAIAQDTPRLHTVGGITVTLGISEEELKGAVDAATSLARIDLAHAANFTVGPVAVAPSLRTITGPAGDAVLEPKVMQAMVALGEMNGAILSRDDLIERCWEGRVVGESSINRVISLLRAGLKSVCGETVKIENVPKVGYRLLVAPDWSPAEKEPEAANETVAAKAAVTCPLRSGPF